MTLEQYLDGAKKCGLLVHASEAAEMLCVSRERVCQLVEEGILQLAKIDGRRYIGLKSVRHRAKTRRRKYWAEVRIS